MTKNLLTLILMISTTVPLQGQWSISLDLDREWNSNPFYWQEGMPSWITAIAAQIQYDADQYLLQYSGIFSAFEQIPERNFYWHQLYLSTGSESFQYGGVFEQRINRNDYHFFEYQSGRFYLQSSFQSAGFHFTIQNTLSFNRFQELQEMNHLLAASSFMINHSFVTRTSFIFGMSAYLKRYSPSFLISPWQQPQFPANQNGRGRGSTSASGDQSFDSNVPETPYFSGIAISLRVAQSLFSTTGLSVYGTRRMALTEASPIFIGRENTYFDGSEFFDDPFQYESHLLGTDLTQILPGQSSVRFSVFTTKRNYLSQGIYFSDGSFSSEPTRRDVLWGAALDFQKVLTLGKESPASILIGLSLSWLKNRSNSYWYSFESRSITASIGWTR